MRSPTARYRRRCRAADKMQFYTQYERPFALFHTDEGTISQGTLPPAKKKKKKKKKKRFKVERVDGT